MCSAQECLPWLATLLQCPTRRKILSVLSRHLFTSLNFAVLHHTKSWSARTIHDRHDVACQASTHESNGARATGTSPSSLPAPQPSSRKDFPPSSGSATQPSNIPHDTSERTRRAKIEELVHTLELKCKDTEAIFSLVNLPGAGFDCRSQVMVETNDRPAIGWGDVAFTGVVVYFREKSLLLGEIDCSAAGGRPDCFMRLRFEVCSQQAGLCLDITMPGEQSVVTISIGAEALNHTFGCSAFQMCEPFHSSWSSAIEDANLTPRLHNLEQRGHLSVIRLRCLPKGARDVSRRQIDGFTISGDVTSKQLKEWALIMSTTTAKTVPLIDGRPMTQQEMILGLIALADHDTIELYVPHSIAQANSHTAQCHSLAESHSANNFATNEPCRIMFDSSTTIGLHYFAQWFTTTMFLCVTNGNFWWYRLQSRVDWMNRRFPFGDLVPPPWLISESSARPSFAPDMEIWQDGTDWRSSFAQDGGRQPLKWKSLKLPRHSRREEFIFAAGLAQTREIEIQRWKLNETLWAYGVERRVWAYFKPYSALKDGLLVRIIPTQAVEEQLRDCLPPLGTGMEISFLDGKEGPSLRGITTSHCQTEAGLIVAACHATVEHNISLDRPLPVAVRFNDVFQSYERTSYALSWPQNLEIEACTNKLTVEKLLLGQGTSMATPFSGPGIGLDKQAYRNRLLQAGLDSQQMAVALNPLLHSVTVMTGSTGTGKTYVLAHMIVSFILQGVKVLVTTTTEPERDELLSTVLDLIIKSSTIAAHIRQQLLTSICVAEGATIDGIHDPWRNDSHRATPEQRNLRTTVLWDLLVGKSMPAANEIEATHGLTMRQRLLAERLRDGNHPWLTPKAQEYLRDIKHFKDNEHDVTRDVMQEQLPYLRQLYMLFTEQYLEEYCLAVFTTNARACTMSLRQQYKPKVLFVEDAGPGLDPANACMAVAQTCEAIIIAGRVEQSTSSVPNEHNECSMINDWSLLGTISGPQDLALADERVHAIELTIDHSAKSPVDFDTR